MHSSRTLANGHYTSYIPPERCASRNSTRCSSPDEEEDGGCEAVEMTLDEVINGRGEGFPGLMGVVNAYLNSLNVDVATKCELRRYLDLIKYRAKGVFVLRGHRSRVNHWAQD